VPLLQRAVAVHPAALGREAAAGERVSGAKGDHMDSAATAAAADIEAAAAPLSRR
jgi:hypothetical protein